MGARTLGIRLERLAGTEHRPRHLRACLDLHVRVSGPLTFTPPERRHACGKPLLATIDGCLRPTSVKAYLGLPVFVSYHVSHNAKFRCSLRPPVKRKQPQNQLSNYLTQLRCVIRPTCVCCALHFEFGACVTHEVGLTTHRIFVSVDNSDVSYGLPRAPNSNMERPAHTSKPYETSTLVGLVEVALRHVEI